MRLLKLLLVSLCAGALSQALAADPPAPSSPALSTPAASVSKPEAATTAASLEAQTKRLRSAGYKAEVHNGVTVFCRNETKMGTRFETKLCANGDDIERAARDAKNFVQKGQMQNPLRSQ